MHIIVACVAVVNLVPRVFSSLSLQGARRRDPGNEVDRAVASFLRVWKVPLVLLERKRLLRRLTLLRP